MALANFFDKVNLSASQVLKGHDRSQFEAKLLSHCINLVFSEEMTNSCYQGKVALDLLVRLFSRFYPNVKFSCPNPSVDTAKNINKLKAIAWSINPEINLNDDQQETINVVIGIVEDVTADHPTLYIGARNWTGLLSTETCRPFDQSNNPFGSAVAVCLAAANLFRLIFQEELEHPLLDTDVCFSAFHQQIAYTEEPPLPEELELNFTLVGTGAIGNAVLWSLTQLVNLKGNITLIDKESVSLSNLQRYLLMSQDDVGLEKVQILKELLEIHPALRVHTYPTTWQGAMKDLRQEQITLFATALDTGRDRLLVQTSLPKKIINAWTSPGSLGVSRHLDFRSEVCLACLYLPAQEEPGDSVKIALALNVSEHERTIRQYLANNLPIDDALIQLLHVHGGSEKELLETYRGKHVRILYSEGICGGQILSLSSTSGSQDMEVPMAHESALAGILLAAEVIIESHQLRKEKLPELTKIDLLRPLHKYLLEAEAKHYSGKCICQDETFIDCYQSKWFEGQHYQNKKYSI